MEAVIRLVPQKLSQLFSLEVLRILPIRQLSVH